MRLLFHRLNVRIVVCLLCFSTVCEASIRLATYNLDNYLVMDRFIDGAWRPCYPKPEAEKEMVRAVIKQTLPAILALQEMGPLPFLDELKADLDREGIRYPYAIHMQGDDTVRHLAVFSKIPPVEVVRHTDLKIVYQKRREQVKRGMLELSFEQSDGKVFKLFVVHLKSRRTSVSTDPQALQQRTREAEACRNRIIERTLEMGISDFIIAGDFNDHPASAPLRRFYQRGDLKIGTLLLSLDSNGDRWTHYYKKEVVYSLVDGFIVSKSLLPKIKDGHGHIADRPHVTEGSDHRMVYLDLF